MKYISKLLEKKISNYLTHHYPEDEVKSAVWDYVSGYITAVNDELRKGKMVSDITSLLDPAFTKEQLIDVYRTVDWDYMKNVYGITKENVREKVGEVLVNKAYMSTTTIPVSPWADRWLPDELLFHITSNKRVKCIVVNDLFTKDEIDCAFQNEILLPRNTKLRINKVEVKKGEGFSKEGTYFIEAVII